MGAQIGKGTFDHVRALRQSSPDGSLRCLGPAAGEMRITGIEARFDDGSGDADTGDAAAER